MTGYSTYTRWQRIEAHAKQLGFRIGNPKHGQWGINESGVDQVSLYPSEEALPVYTRDAELFTGTFSQVEFFLAGWGQARSYDMILRVTDDKRRKKFEDKERERQRLEQERIEKKKMFAILANKKEQEVERIV